MQALYAVGRFIKKYILLFCKGLAIGVSVIIPGVSGGTMAILLGIYEKILNAVNTLFKRFRENFVFLAVLAAGALISVFALAKGVDFMLEHYLAVTNFFFIGIILAGIPSVYKESALCYGGLMRDETQSSGKKIKRIGLDLIPFVLGAAAVIGIGLMQENIVNAAAIDGAGGFFIRMVVGAAVAAALVLPGISGSYFMKVIGLYHAFTTAVSELDILFLLPVAIGVLIGIFATAKLMSVLLKRFKRGTYLAILGFLAASLYGLVTEQLPVGMEILFCTAAAVGGILLIILITMLTKVVRNRSEADALPTGCGQGGQCDPSVPIEGERPDAAD